MDSQYAQQLLFKVKNDYNQIAENFASTRTQVWPEINFLFDYIKPGDKVLDLGCGHGRYLLEIKKRGGIYFGIDGSKELIKIAKDKYPKENIQMADVLTLPFKNNFFDIVYSLAVLHHIPSVALREQFLRETEKVIKPGGFVILTVWRPKNKAEKRIFWKFFLKKFFGCSQLDFGDVIEPWFGNNKGERYYHCFTKQELAGLAKRAGLKIDKIDTIGTSLGARNNIYLVAQKRQQK